MSHIIIIGGTKGLGKAFLETIRQDYANVSVFARTTPTESREFANVHFIQADVTNPILLKAGIEEAVRKGGKIKGIVFFQQYRGKEQRWEGKLASTLTATRDTLDLCAEHFVGEGDKSIVLLTSIASQMVADEQDEGYHAAKTGLLGLARYYACKFGPIGVRINCVSPGTVLKEASKHHFIENPELHDWFKQIIPLRRMGTENEVASVIRFLLSEAASFVTGQELIVDGGAGLRSQESLARILFPHRSQAAHAVPAKRRLSPEFQKSSP
jgi:NAD(P)-dependent dehydrogenase (short-subunit alcohol dehydrogenase family)